MEKELGISLGRASSIRSVDAVVADICIRLQVQNALHLKNGLILTGQQYWTVPLSCSPPVPPSAQP